MESFQIKAEEKNSTSILLEEENNLEKEDIDYRKISWEELYQKILKLDQKDGQMAGCGKFQIIATVILILTFDSFGWVVYGLGYYELFPRMMCTKDDGIY